MKCELCGRTVEQETKSDFLRTVYKSSLGFERGYFRPYLTAEEMYALHGKGEHTVCMNRRACRVRQDRNRENNIQYPVG
jgi:hypothetical protein